jgi:hypothetical protein
MPRIDLNLRNFIIAECLNGRKLLPRPSPHGATNWGDSPIKAEVRMTEPDRAPLRWRGNIHRAVAWLRAPSDGEDQASFQLDVIWSNGVERLPEVYALERSNPCFEVAWSLLRTALTSRLNVLIVPAGPGTLGAIRGDGKAPVRTVVLRVFSSAHMTREFFDESEKRMGGWPTQPNG